MLDNLVCPISNVRIDRNVVRTNGLLSAGLMAAFVYTRSPWIIVPVAVDYVFRAMMDGPASPMTRLSRALVTALKLPFRATDKAPKVFAARIGTCFSVGAAVTCFVAPAASPWLAGTLAVFATLESVFDFCAGCVVYTYIALPLYKARDAAMAVSWLRDLNDPMLLAIADRFQKVAFDRGARIVTEGEVGTEMYVIRAGEIEVFRGASGAETVVGTYKRGDFFGEMALLTGNTRSASVRARTPVVAFKLDKSDFDGLLQAHPGMREILERTAAARAARDEAAQA